MGDVRPRRAHVHPISCWAWLVVDSQTIGRTQRKAFAWHAKAGLAGPMAAGCFPAASPGVYTTTWAVDVQFGDAFVCCGGEFGFGNGGVSGGTVRWSRLSPTCANCVGQLGHVDLCFSMKAC